MIIHLLYPRIFIAIHGLAQVHEKAYFVKDCSHVSDRMILIPPHHKDCGPKQRREVKLSNLVYRQQAMCNQSAAETAKWATLNENPTRTVASILGTDYLKAEILSDEKVLVSYCMEKLVRAKNILKDHKLNGDCFVHPPVHVEGVVKYLDGEVMELLAESDRVDCDKVKEVNMRGKPVVVMDEDGRLILLVGNKHAVDNTHKGHSPAKRSIKNFFQEDWKGIQRNWRWFQGVWRRSEKTFTE